MTMRQITLKISRFCYSRMGVFGSYTIGDQTYYTVEKPWINNEPFVSCIPTGKYLLRPRRYYRGGYDALEVLKVEGRSHILFHMGNRAADVQGCICPGTALSCIYGEWSVKSSSVAFKDLMEYNPNVLNIENGASLVKDGSERGNLLALDPISPI